jgi:hypothetical protein
VAFRAKFELKKNDAVWRRIAGSAKMLANRGAYVKAGVLGSANVVHDETGLTNVRLALIHEFGAPNANIPSRPWVGAAFRLHRDEYKAALGKVVAQVFAGKLDYEVGLGRIGAKMAADMKRFVRDGLVVPPLVSEGETYRRKAQKTRPGSPGTPVALLDSSRMIGAVTWQVCSGGK